MMKIITQNTLLLLLLIFATGCATQQKTISRQKEWAQSVTSLGIENMHQVDKKIYRSAQPSKEEFKKLYNFGIRNDLNLRQLHDDKEKLEGLNICYYHIPINTSKMTYDQLVDAVAFLVASKGKTIVHCLHGSDRTGTVVAGYRIAAQSWSKKRAVDEFIHGGYGYHAFWFPNLPKLLENLNRDQFVADVKKRAKEFENRHDDDCL